MRVVHAWVLALMVLCAPADADRARFDEIASAIEDAAGGDSGLVATLVALAARESHFRPDAVGEDAFGRSYGLFQIHESNRCRFAASTLCDARADVFLDLRFSAQVAARMVRESAVVCHYQPPEDRLAWYASGGPTCDVPEGLAASRNRTRLAAWLLAARPPFWSSRAVDVFAKHARRRAPGPGVE